MCRGAMMRPRGRSRGRASGRIARLLEEGTLRTKTSRPRVLRSRMPPRPGRTSPGKPARGFMDVAQRAGSGKAAGPHGKIVLRVALAGTARQRSLPRCRGGRVGTGELSVG